MREIICAGGAYGPEAISANTSACFAVRNPTTSRRALACTRQARRSNPHS
jgi:hypothetical protein